jgi:hypothetical protein
MKKAEPNKIYPEIQHPDGTLRNAFDADAQSLYGKPYHLLNPDEKAAAKAACKNTPIAVSFMTEPSKPVEPPKPTKADEATESRKADYLATIEAKKANEIERLNAAADRGKAQREIQDLRLKLQRGHYPAGIERAEALKSLYTLENNLRLKQ